MGLPDIGEILSFLKSSGNFALHAAPHAAREFAAVQKGKMAANEAYEERKEKEHERARQERLDAAAEAKRVLDMEYLQEQIRAQRAKTDAPEEVDPEQWETKEAADGTYIQINKRTGQSRPVSGVDGTRVRAPQPRGPAPPRDPIIGYGARDMDTYLDRVQQVEGVRSKLGAGSPKSLPPEEDESSLYAKAKEMISRGLDVGAVANWSARNDQPYKTVLNDQRRRELIKRAWRDVNAGAIAEAEAGDLRDRDQREWDGLSAEITAEGRDPRLELGPRP